jgi:Tol biopolymer transport system component
LPLTAGQRLGPYEIVAPIGAGGMGEVYRARDTRLERDVAVKVLPVRLAEDPEALARFEREAKAVAALSHPGILAIHDFGRDAGTAYAAMELLDGETLRQRLAAGALPARKAVDFALQMAQALAAAHDKGIVHRDLKPENVFVTRDGRVKLLDFGLARRDGEAAGDDTHSPTLAHATEPGTLMGTVGYMSPEQVRGEPVDGRSDIFSLGSVLYEMLSGRRAFARDTPAETMTAILREEPADLLAGAEGLPPPLGHIVLHCLEKQPSERFQSVRDLAFDLSSLTDSRVRHERVGGAGSARWVGRYGRTVALVAVTGLAGLLAGRLTSRTGKATTGPAVGASFVQLTDQPGIERDPSLSPDGKSVVYAADTLGNLDLFLLRVGGRNPVNLTPDSPTDDHQPAFSPDGERIAFRSERAGGGIFVMGSTGESVKRLTDFGYDPSWSPDGREVAVATTSFYYPTDASSHTNEIWAVDVTTGETRRLIRRGRAAFQPQWSPHGRRIAYWSLRGNSGQRDLWTSAADGSDADTGGVAVTDDAPLDWSPAWSPDGTYLYFSSSRGGTMNLWRVAIDEATGRVGGVPEPLTTPSVWSGQPSLSKDGRQLAFATLDWRSTLLRVGFDPVKEEIVGSPTSILRSTKPIRDHDLSPDGQWVAFNQAGVREDIVVARLDGSQYRRLTDDPFRERGPIWSPDGKRIAFYSDRGGTYEIWTIHPDGSGLVQLTRDSKGTMVWSLWSPDGSRFAVSTIPGDWILFDVNPATGALKQVAVPHMAGSTFWPFSWSPDGKRIAGPLRGEDGVARGIALFSLETRSYEVKRIESNMQWITPLWMSDSRRLLVRDPRGISVMEPGTWRTKRLFDVGGYMIGRSVSLSRDNRFITYTETANEGDIWLVNLR